MIYRLEEIIPLIGSANSKRKKIVAFKNENGEAVNVLMNHKIKYASFKKSISCACCGKNGEYFQLEYNKEESSHFFNLYAEDGTLMTVDHIKPVSMGGPKKSMSNVQTLCKDCNELKDDKLLSIEKLRQAKKEYDKLKIQNPHITKTIFHKKFNNISLSKEPKLIKRLNGTLRMSRVSSTIEGDYINIVVTDKNSKLIILEVKIPEKECMNFLSSMITEIQMDYFQNTDIGKRREIKIIEVAIPSSPTEEELEDILSGIEKTGWKASIYNLKNAKAVKYVEHHAIKNIVVERWVDNES